MKISFQFLNLIIWIKSDYGLFLDTSLIVSSIAFLPGVSKVSTFFSLAAILFFLTFLRPGSTAKNDPFLAPP